jgi:hypothetical protein
MPRRGRRSTCREIDLRSYPDDVRASRSYFATTSAARLKTQALTRRNQNALTEDAAEESLRPISGYAVSSAWSQASARQSLVQGWLLDALNHHNFYRTARRFELEPELFLQRGEQRRSIRIARRSRRRRARPRPEGPQSTVAGFNAGPSRPSSRAFTRA